MRSIEDDLYLKGLETRLPEDLQPDDEFRISVLPTIKLFRHLCTFKGEMGIYRQEGEWFCRVGDYGGIYLEDLPASTDVVIHTHPRVLDMRHCIPSIFDFVHVHSTDARFFVASPLGMARYWPLSLKVRESKEDLKIYMRLYEMGERAVFPWEEVDFFRQMQERGCRWEMSTWKKIESDKKLLQLLVDKGPVS